MTYRDLILRLRNAGSTAPEHEADELLRVIAGYDRKWRFNYPSAKIPPEVLEALKKREAGLPLQYILGEAWFYGNRFAVSPDCLIPQPDTEHLVALAIHEMKTGHETVLDLCTGSGCVIASILKEVPNAAGTAVDISEAALSIARENLRALGCLERTVLLSADIFGREVLDLIKNADIIVSNPPYIATDIIPTLSREVRHEPKIALDGGADGMDFYRRIVLELTKHMKPDAKMFLEIGYDQGEKVKSLAASVGLVCQIHKDFGGNDRVAEVLVSLPQV